MSSNLNSRHGSEILSTQPSKTENAGPLPYVQAAPMIGPRRVRNTAQRGMATSSLQPGVAKNSESKPEDGQSCRPVSELSLPAAEIDSAELDGGSLVELIEDPRHPAQTLLAVWKDGEIGRASCRERV